MLFSFVDMFTFKRCNFPLNTFIKLMLPLIKCSDINTFSSRPLLILVQMKLMDMYLGIFGLLHNFYAFGRPSESFLPTIEAIYADHVRLNM